MNKNEPKELKDAKQELVTAQEQLGKWQNELAEWEQKRTNLDATSPDAQEQLIQIEAGISIRQKAISQLMQKCNQVNMEIEKIEKELLQQQAKDKLKEFDELVKLIAGQLDQVGQSMGKLDALRTEIKGKYKLNTPDVFGNEIQVTLKALEKRKYIYPQYYGIKPRPDRKTQLIASQKANIKRIEDHIKDLEKKKNRTYTKKDVRPDISYLDEIAKVRNRLEVAQYSLAMLEGRGKEFIEDEEAQIRADLERQRAETEAGIAGWKKRWRERSKQQKEEANKENAN